MLAVISTASWPLPCRRRVSPVAVAAPFAFRRFVTSIMAGPPLSSVRGMPALFTSCMSLLRMTPTNRRLGSIFPIILVLRVRLPILVTKLPTIRRPMLVLSSVCCILCRVLPTPALSTPLRLCRSP